mgnify:CR=1 FL=1
MHSTKSKFLTLTIIFSLFASGCMEDMKESRANLSEDGIEFNIEVSDPTDKGATFLITNNGTDRNTWYAFAYDDVNTAPEAAINRKVRELTESEDGVKSVIQRGTKRIRIDDGLSPATRYRYVVFGLTSEGTVYGKPASCEFKTVHMETTYEVELTEETSSSAELTVTPGGSSTDTWFAFVSDDTTTPAEELINKELVNVEDIAEVLHSGKKALTFNGLEAAKKLRAIVTGLDSDGETFGKPAEFTFRLTPEATANDAWKVTYDGYVTPQGADKPYRKITNTSTDSERYFISVISENNLQTAFNNDINKYIKYAIENLTSASTGWSKYVFTQTGSMYYTLRTRKSYYAFAIGIDRNGYFTGKFAISDKCYIEGNVDYIYGDSMMVFDECEVFSNQHESYITAASKRPHNRFGITFLDCRLTAKNPGEPDHDGVPFEYFYLGRPWHNTPKVAFIRCEEPGSVHPDGWTVMNPSAVPDFCEYRCFGPGASPDRLMSRKMGGRQLGDDEAAAYTVANIFSKDSSPLYEEDWNPDKILSIFER